MTGGMRAETLDGCRDGLGDGRVAVCRVEVIGPDIFDIDLTLYLSGLLARLLASLSTSGFVSSCIREIASSSVLQDLHSCILHRAAITLWLACDAGHDFPVSPIL